MARLVAYDFLSTMRNGNRILSAAVVGSERSSGLHSFLKSGITNICSSCLASLRVSPHDWRAVNIAASRLTGPDRGTGTGPDWTDL